MRNAETREGSRLNRFLRDLPKLREREARKQLRKERLDKKDRDAFEKRTGLTLQPYRVLLRDGSEEVHRQRLDEALRAELGPKMTVFSWSVDEHILGRLGWQSWDSNACDLTFDPASSVRIWYYEDPDRKT